MAAALSQTRHLASQKPALALHANFRACHAHFAHGGGACGNSASQAATSHPVFQSKALYPGLRSTAASRHRGALSITLASPEPASPWYEEAHQETAPGWKSQLLEVAAPPPAIRVPAAQDANHGYTWLTHPCPSNPFRTRADEDMWYVEPNMEQRKLAMALGLPLFGIC